MQARHPFQISQKLRFHRQSEANTQKTPKFRNIQERFWQTTLVGILQKITRSKHARSCLHSRSPRSSYKRSSDKRSSHKRAVARAAAPAGGMVVAMGRVQVRLRPSAHPLSEAPRRRSARWHVPVSRHARLLAARVPAADRDHRASRTLCESSDSPASNASAMGRHLLLRRRIAANSGSRRRASWQVRTRRRPASPPSHADHPRSARRQAQPKKLWTLPKSICRIPIPQSPICSPSNRIPDRLPPKACVRRSRAPSLPAMSVVPPSPELNSSAKPAAKRLTANVIPPAPEVSHASTRTSPTLSQRPIVPPAPNVSRDKMRTANPLAPTVIAPAPRDAQRDLASSRIPMTQTVDVVAPPVSAPQRDVSSTPKLSLPAPAVVAPPPSQVSRDLNSWGSSATGDLRAKPVPPPPTASGGGSLARSGAGTLTPQVVPPPASIGGAGSQKNGPGIGSRSGQSAGSLLGSANVVPPPPGLGGGKALSGSGRGNKGTGAGGPLDLGSSVAPPSNAGGNAAGNGVVISSQPGNQSWTAELHRRRARHVAQRHGKKRPRRQRRRSRHRQRQRPRQRVARRRFGRRQRRHRTRLRSQRPRRNFALSRPRRRGQRHQRRARRARRFRAGWHDHHQSAQFRSSRGDAPATGPGRSSTNAHGGPGYTVKATSSSGGVFNRYGQLKGDNYSIYIETSLGTAVMQYADAASAAHPYSGDLTAPEPMRMICLRECVRLTWYSPASSTAPEI